MIKLIAKPIVKRMRSGDRSPEANLSFPAGYDEAKRRVTVTHDLTYPSQYHNNLYDIYCPAGCQQPLPTIVWIHGGSFVAGTRRGVVNVCVMLAQQGYTVIAAEYAKPPEAKHPAAVTQMQELYSHLCTAVHPQVDTQDFFIAGDSAGAQIASEFAAVQTNPALAQEMRMQAAVPAGALRGAILICGPYDLASIRKVKHKALRFGLWLLGRAMFGGLPWYKSAGCRQSTTALHITPDYPPAYITDGNTISFEVQGRRLGEALRAQGVPVAESYFDLAQGEVQHDYLFSLADEHAQLCLEDIIRFIEQYRRQLL